MSKFLNIGIIKNKANYDDYKLDFFLQRMSDLRNQEVWEKQEIVELFNYMIPDFNHKETGKYLDGKM